MQKTRKLTLGALMLALATALSLVGIKMPFGGEMTLGSMLPVIAFSYMYPLKESAVLSFTYALIQMSLGFVPPPVQNFSSFFAVIMIDYIIAFWVLGFGGVISKKIKNIRLKYTFGTSVVIILRFLCHFVSGILIWSCYAPEGQSPAVYSLIYNGSYMAGELVLSVVIMFFISPALEKIKNKK